MVIKARWVHVIPTPSTTTAPLPSTSAQSSPFHCINIKLHKHSIILTLQPGPEVVGGAHFLITDASYIVTHHCSCENSWSLESFRLQGFSHLNNPTPTPGTRVHSFRPYVQTQSTPMHTQKDTHRHMHTHLLPVVLDRGDALVRALMRFGLFRWAAWRTRPRGCCWARLPMKSRMSM